MTTPSDHPPAIPPIGVRQRHRLIFDCGTVADTVIFVPLGLSPEQPARLSGEAMP